MEKGNSGDLHELDPHTTESDYSAVPSEMA